MRTADKILVLDGVKRAEHTWMYIHDDGELSIWQEEMIFMNQDIQVTSDVLKKAYFVLASFCGACIDDDEHFHLVHDGENVQPYIDEVVKTLQEFEPRFQGFKFNTYRHFDFSSDYEIEIDNFMGAVKMESKNLLKKFLETHNVSINEFILNHNYVLVIDNELNMYQKFKDWNFINMDLVKEEFDVEVED